MLAPSGKGCGRGVLALKSWEPLRKPGESISKSKCQDSGDNSKNSNSTQANKVFPVAPSIKDGQNPVLLVKYNYQANPDEPGGFPEMTVKQGQKVQFVNVHPEQSLWWLVKDQIGEGYAPASYMMVLDDMPSNLPWLENKLEEKEESQPKTDAFANAPVKPYVSAYGGGVSVGPNQERKYYCETCDKQLNGTKPYQAHMVSKAHKEEVEAQAYNS